MKIIEGFLRAYGIRRSTVYVCMRFFQLKFSVYAGLYLLAGYLSYIAVIPHLPTNLLQSHVTTDGQSVSPSWWRAPSGAHVCYCILVKWSYTFILYPSRFTMKYRARSQCNLDIPSGLAQQ
jgi:hypothetical protein